MKVIIQRAKNAQVSVNNETVGKITQGLLLLVGITHTDTEVEVHYLAKKIAGMRIFDDEQGKMNLSIMDVGGDILSISQFTLYANCKHGNRPGFTDAAQPAMARTLYEQFNTILKTEHNIHVETGRFGQHMQVDFTNDGPVTIVLDTEILMKK